MAENTPSWINSEFLGKALRFNGKHPDIEVISYEIAPAASASDHYGSVMYRVVVITSESGKTDKMSVIVKCELQHEGLPESNEKPDASTAFILEAKTYMNIHSPMSDTLKENIPDYKPFAPKFVYLYQQRPINAIVIEDLKKDKFCLANVRLGLDLRHCQLVMSKIAQYHASSIVLRDKNPNFLQDFSSNFYTEEADGALANIFRGTFNNCAEVISNWSGFEKYVHVLRSMSVKITSDMTKAMQTDDTGFNVLNHGDLWLKNMMFQYNEQTGEVQDVRFVDFQLSYYGSPVLDFFYFLLSRASLRFLDDIDVCLMCIIPRYMRYSFLTWSRESSASKQMFENELNIETYSRVFAVNSNSCVSRWQIQIMFKIYLN
ncbi:hypothetical protein L9F63_024160 [Diploptera punctata]|uniref:CHK kinase-like domain-containing protein n=1 Tax=Diploptera punctata TaxID=6984 RepID=A0AAD8E8L1_DIPPU|nr:hypothetical protein L9F63_024160 [Diploptera punctata]